MEPRIFAVLLLVAVINMIDTLAYGARLAGARTKSPSVAISLYNIVALTSRTANLIQLPLVASIVDSALYTGHGGSLLSIFRLIILAQSGGVLLGIVFIPLAVKAFTWGIVRMEKTHSVPVVVLELFRPANLRKAAALPVAGVRHLKSLRMSDLPYTFILTNPILTAFYSVGVLAAIYGGYLIPEYRLTASQLSGIINGVATILLVTVVDPVSALILDDTLKGKRNLEDLRSAVAMLAAGKFAGTLAAQLLLVPAAYVIIYITRLIV